jgi:ABC-2 type transport system permease protein
VYLKGVGFEVLWPQILGMLVLGAALLALSIMRFRKALE